LEKRIIESIKDARYILIVTHINPDADTISSALALSNFMYREKIKHKVYNDDINFLPRNLDFLPKFDKITSMIPKFYDLVIYVDCADENRTGFKSDGIKVINIDHHKSNTSFGDINIVKANKASTAEVLYEVFEKAEISISKDMAVCFYVGIYDDSNAFTTPRVDSKTFQIVSNLLNTGIKPADIMQKLTMRESLAKYRMTAKILDSLKLYQEGKVAIIYATKKWLTETGASVNECDDVVNMTLNLSVVDVVAYFRVVKSKVRVSLRSKNGVDVTVIAKEFDGGGHKNAAGLTIDTDDISIAIKQFISTAKNYI
jgi:phosphoesterase RecJ-like protein